MWCSFMHMMIFLYRSNLIDRPRFKAVVSRMGLSAAEVLLGRQTHTAGGFFSVGRSVSGAAEYIATYLSK